MKSLRKRWKISQKFLGETVEEKHIIKTALENFKKKSKSSPVKIAKETIKKNRRKSEQKNKFVKF